MSETALKDLNNIPATERKSEGSGKACLTKPPVDNANGNTEESQKKKNCSSLVSPHVNGNQAVPADSVVEVGTVEVEYIDSENLNDLEDVDACVKTLLAGLDSKDWVLVCDTLNNVRRLSIFHKEAMLDILGDVITRIAKALKSPRSAVIKTAIMTSADIFGAYNDLIIDSLDPLLLQLLLKSSQDKRFVCEAAEKALISMTTCISPISLLPKLQPYLKHKHPRVRAKASMCFSRSVPQLGAEGINTYGIDKLIQVAASQLSDQLPESREAARTLLLELQNVYEKFPNLVPAATVSEDPKTETVSEDSKTETVSEDAKTVTVSEDPETVTVSEDPETETVSEEPEIATESWESFCQSNLSPLSAQAVLRVTSIAREGLVS
ncbi:putative armadillo-like helical protein [Medicago truncatula]|uniref:Clasp amino-terminal protein n=1 Tax=Medicago truncatula TaxID=3880 RepID=G7ZZX0_MEDTR|nr:uncharacterized protein LOC25495191 [Medicago truncatula]XP_039682590.1 uncharacterized protein LOC25495191 [Medicago truncatula]KEH24867.1 clasp amino-terminal protein [Medicago truncatula]RHN49848.1 putative armadillo-like helical protein [Medicago truncatula]